MIKIVIVGGRSMMEAAKCQELIDAEYLRQHFGSVEALESLGIMLKNDLNEFNEIITQVLRLLYKNWLTIKEWIRELYISRVYMSIKKWSALLDHVFTRRTVKSTSPIVRNKPGGRA